MLFLLRLGLSISTRDPTAVCAAQYNIILEKSWTISNIEDALILSDVKSYAGLGLMRTWEETTKTSCRWMMYEWVIGDGQRGRWHGLAGSHLYFRAAGAINMANHHRVWSESITYGVVKRLNNYLRQKHQYYLNSRASQFSTHYSPTKTCFVVCQGFTTIDMMILIHIYSIIIVLPLCLGWGWIELKIKNTICKLILFNNIYIKAILIKKK